jgi:DnaJ-class molecular chaperone
MKRITLYTNCARCGGHGRVPERPGAPRTEVCPSCRGKGVVATEDGRAIIGLLGVVGLDELLPEG